MIYPKLVTVRYQNLTAAGMPRFPVVVKIWNDGEKI